jgi:hypothetical protein
MIGNLFPGQGLGFTPSKYCCFGLGAMTVTEIPLPPQPPIVVGGGSYYPDFVTVHDNAYSRHDDAEIIELLSILFQVIE